MIKKKPIIFNSQAVRAILENRKIQTRRPIKPQPSPFAGWAQVEPKLVSYGFNEETGHGYASYEDGSFRQFPSPYNVGDQLWVQETWWDRRDHIPMVEDLNAIHYAADNWYPPDELAHIHYKRPSVHMPRWASRITLKVTSVRIEQIQNISPVDIEAEGTPLTDQLVYHVMDLYQHQRYRDFIQMWDSNYAKRGYSWVRNPWVWVIEFIVIPSEIEKENG